MYCGKITAFQNQIYPPIITMKQSNRELTKKPPKDYKNIIIDRLKKNSYQEDNKKSMQHSLKTQCTPNDKTQDFSERFFEEFDLNCKVRYKPVEAKENRKPLTRCLYLELKDIWEKELKENDSGNVRRKRCTTEDHVSRSNIHRYAAAEKNSNSKKNLDNKDSKGSFLGSQKNINRQKRMNTAMSRTEAIYLSRQPSLTNFKNDKN